jgi:hypothetical protein
MRQATCVPGDNVMIIAIVVIGAPPHSRIS